MIEWTSVFLHNIGKFGISPLCSLPINSCHSLPQEKIVTYWFIWTLSYYSSEQLFMQQSQVLASDSSTHAHVYLGSAPKQRNCCIGGVVCSAKDIQKYIRYLTEKIGLYFFFFWSLCEDYIFRAGHFYREEQVTKEESLTKSSVNLNSSFREGENCFSW